MALRDSDAFLEFLQEGWVKYLADQQPAEVLAREPSPTYRSGSALPFEEADVRVYMDNLFVDGKLHPVQIPSGWTIQGWAEVGIQMAKQHHKRQRFGRLLERLQRMLPGCDAGHNDWMDFAERWAELTVLRHELSSDLQSPAMEAQYRALHVRLEAQFGDWMLSRYHTLHSLPFLPKPAMVHQIPRFMAHQERPCGGSRLALVIVDGLSMDQWLVIRQVWQDEKQPWCVQVGSVFTWVPTITTIARQALFAGTIPAFFPASWSTTQEEASQWRRFWSEQGLHPASVNYVRGLGVKGQTPDGTMALDQDGELETELLSLMENSSVKVLGLVVNTVDNIMHGMQLGTAGMHEQVRLWLTHYRYLTRLVEQLVEAMFTVYLASDHGNVWARGIGRPNEGVLVETRGQRARIYTDPAFASMARQQSPSALQWTNVGLPPGMIVLLAPGLDAFMDAGRDGVCHGGIGLEEVIVPFIRITKAVAA